MQRVEQDDAETFRVAVMYGPSGCGKSSFVRAGLLPRLSERVKTVHVEARPQGTESRLLAAIQPPDVTQAILDCLDLPGRAPPTAEAVPDPDAVEEWPGGFEATL